MNEGSIFPHNVGLHNKLYRIVNFVVGCSDARI